MTPKDKAKELVDKYHLINILNNYEVKQCALIEVDGLIKETSFEVPNIRQRYWQEVKEEINNL